MKLKPKLKIILTVIIHKLYSPNFNFYESKYSKKKKYKASKYEIKNVGCHSKNKTIIAIKTFFNWK